MLTPNQPKASRPSTLAAATRQGVGRRCPCTVAPPAERSAPHSPQLLAAGLPRRSKPHLRHRVSSPTRRPRNARTTRTRDTTAATRGTTSQSHPIPLSPVMPQIVTDARRKATQKARGTGRGRSFVRGWLLDQPTSSSTAFCTLLGTGAYFSGSIALAPGLGSCCGVRSCSRTSPPAAPRPR